jgi:hypothetical protein
MIPRCPISDDGFISKLQKAHRQLCRAIVHGLPPKATQSLDAPLPYLGRKPIATSMLRSSTSGGASVTTPGQVSGAWSRLMGGTPKEFIACSVQLAIVRFATSRYALCQGNRQKNSLYISIAHDCQQSAVANIFPHIAAGPSAPNMEPLVKSAGCGIFFVSVLPEAGFTKTGAGLPK